MAAFTSGADGCPLGSSYKCLYKFGVKDPRHPITIGTTLMDLIFQLNECIVINLLFLLANNVNASRNSYIK